MTTPPRIVGKGLGHLKIFPTLGWILCTFSTPRFCCTSKMKKVSICLPFAVTFGPPSMRNVVLAISCSAGKIKIVASSTCQTTVRKIGCPSRFWNTPYVSWQCRLAATANGLMLATYRPIRKARKYLLWCQLTRGPVSIWRVAKRDQFIYSARGTVVDLAIWAAKMQIFLLYRSVFFFYI